MSAFTAHCKASAQTLPSRLCSCFMGTMSGG